MVERRRPRVTGGVHTTPVGDELLVHVLGSDETHVLGPTTSEVFRRCDGATSPAELEAVFEEQPASHRTALVQLALDQLERVGLIEDGGGSSDVEREGRRNFLKRAAIAAVALPTITTVVTATPAAASSAGCMTNADCAGGQVCIQGLCSPASGSGGPCDDNNDCVPPLVCIGGVCQSQSGSGGSCDEDADCSGGEKCFSGTCKQCGSNDATGDTYCAANQYCDGVNCQPDKASGPSSSCTRNSQCVSGICDGTCRNGSGGSCPSNNSAGDAYCTSSTYCDGSLKCSPEALERKHVRS